MNLRWEWLVSTYLPSSTAIEGREGKHDAFVREFASVVAVFQDRTDALIEMNRDIEQTLDELASGDYVPEAFSKLLARIQETVHLCFASLLLGAERMLNQMERRVQIDRLNLEGYANLDSWVADLDKRIEVILAERLRVVLQTWCAEISKEVEAADSTRERSPAVARRAKEDPVVRRVFSLRP